MVEYKILQLSVSEDNIENKLNEYAQASWQFVTQLDIPAFGCGLLLFLLEREIDDHDRIGQLRR